MAKAEISNETTELVLDAIEEQVDKVVTVTQNNPLIVAGAFLMGFGIGGFVAYKIAVKRTTLKYEDILSVEIEASCQFYKRLAKEGEFESPESAVEALVPTDVVEAVRSYQGRADKVPYNRPEDIPEEKITYHNSTTGEVEERKGAVEEHNVFTDLVSDPQDWNYEVEQRIR